MKEDTFMDDAGWISVKEALPPTKNRIVLGFFPKAPGKINAQCTVSMIDEDLWKYATHWKPLGPPPELYRKA